MGVSVRFETMKSSETEILFCTDGSLLRELLEDPLLQKYSAVMVDEAHERSLNTDVLLGLLKKVTRKRKELRVIVSSATIDAEAFREFFRAETEELELEEDEEEEEKEKKKKGNDDGKFSSSYGQPAIVSNHSHIVFAQTLSNAKEDAVSFGHSFTTEYCIALVPPKRSATAAAKGGPNARNVCSGIGPNKPPLALFKAISKSRHARGVDKASPTSVTKNKRVSSISSSSSLPVSSPILRLIFLLHRGAPKAAAFEEDALFVREAFLRNNAFLVSVSLSFPSLCIVSFKNLSYSSSTSTYFKSIVCFARTSTRSPCRKRTLGTAVTNCVVEKKRTTTTKRSTFRKSASKARPEVILFISLQRMRLIRADYIIFVIVLSVCKVSPLLNTDAN